MNYNDIINEVFLIHDYYGDKYRKYVNNCKRKGKKPLSFNKWKEREILIDRCLGVIANLP